MKLEITIGFGDPHVPSNGGGIELSVLNSASVAIGKLLSAICTDRNAEAKWTGVLLSLEALSLSAVFQFQTSDDVELDVDQLKRLFIAALAIEGATGFSIGELQSFQKAITGIPQADRQESIRVGAKALIAAAVGSHFSPVGISVEGYHTASIREPYRAFEIFYDMRYDTKTWIIYRSGLGAHPNFSAFVTKLREVGFDDVQVGSSEIKLISNDGQGHVEAQNLIQLHFPDVPLRR